MNLYVTSDRVGIETGGGKVTGCEVAAMRGLGPCEVWDRDFLGATKSNFRVPADPWCWDEFAWQREQQEELPKNFHGNLRLVHFYAGTFTQTAQAMRDVGAKITYTADAHDVVKSRQAHLDLGLSYDYPHLTDPVLWQRYLGGYAAADILIVPSTHSKNVMRSFGCTNRIEIIPHGCDIPKCGRCDGAGEAQGSDRPFEWSGPGTYPGPCPVCGVTGEAPIAPLPETFVVGYLGAIGADKGIRYLLEAWKKLNYKDATLLLAGNQSTSPFMHHMIHQFGGGNIQMMGWVKDVADFYNSISVYVQPSVTEGFGIEVLEAMAHGRPVICSTGAGTVDLIQQAEDHCGEWFSPGDINDLASEINRYKERSTFVKADGLVGRKEAEKYTWPKIQKRYSSLWKELIG